jgi:hypothetical protein
VSQFLAGKGISAMDHLPYSPELAPADFWLFPEVKSVLKGKHFSDVEDINRLKKILSFLFRIIKTVLKKAKVLQTL